MWRFWLRLFRRPRTVSDRRRVTAAAQEVLGQRLEAQRLDMERSSAGLRREAAERGRVEAVRRRLIDEFEVAAKTALGGKKAP